MKAGLVKNIIWDWNGTLLDDVQMCIDCMNQLLEPRSLPQLNIEKYREVFTFPVIDYYRKIGINFERDPFSVIGHQFMKLYKERIKNCQLQIGAIKILEANKLNGKKQFILSAMEQEFLLQSLKDLEVFSYFDAIYGIDNQLAAGKNNRAKQMLKDLNIDSNTCILIGDTLHDMEVANLFGIRPLLVANGHQSKSRLLQSGAEVFDSLLGLENILC